MYIISMEQYILKQLFTSDSVGGLVVVLVVFTASRPPPLRRIVVQAESKQNLNRLKVNDG